MKTAWLDRLLPEKWRRREKPSEEHLRDVFANVRENDPALAAIKTLLEDQLENEAMTAMNMSAADTLRLRACDGLRVTFTLLNRIEDVHARSLEWKKEEMKDKAEG